jgi:RHS repeat-associated protein
LTKSYRLSKVNNSYELSFPTESGHVVHRFGPDGGIEHVRQLKGHEEITLDGSPSNWPGMVTHREGELVLSNVCSAISFVPVYEDGLVTHVLYSTMVAGDSGQNEILPGSRIFRAKNASGVITSESRIVNTNGTEQIWSGVTGGTGTVSVARKDIRWESFDSSNNVLSVYELAILNPDTSSAQSNLTQRLIARFPWGDELISETVGYGANDIRTTTYTYNTNSVETNQYGRLQLVEQPDGSWTRYTYDSQGRDLVICTPFQSSPPTAGTNDCRVSRYFYAGDTALPGLNFPSSDVVVSNDARPRLVVVEVLGHEVSRTYSAFLPDQRVSKRCVTAGAAYDAASNLVSVTYDYTNGLFQGRTRKVEREDGTLSIFGYGYDSELQQMSVTNMTGAGNGDTVIDGTLTVTISDVRGRTIAAVTKDIASGLTISGQAYIRDGFGRVTCESNTVTGTYATRIYGCCGPEQETDAAGITTYTTYTDLKQVYASERLGVTTFLKYDVNGAVVESRRSSAGESDIVTRSAFDSAGRLTIATNELGSATTYSYSTNANGGQVMATTFADGNFRVENYYCDGQLQCITGTAVHPVYYEYGVDADGAYTVEYKGPAASATEWIKTYRNMLGRTWKTVYPGGYVQTITFDALGREAKTADGFTSALSAYNDRGEPFRSAVDMNGNSTIDLAGTDRITETENAYTMFDGKDVRQSINRVYPTSGDASPLTVSVSLAAVAGDETWAIAFGRTNHAQTVHSRATASRTETITRPDGTQSIGIYSNDLIRSVEEKDALGGSVASQSFTYDGFNRLQTTTEPAANGAMRVTTQRYNPAGAVTSVNVSAESLSQTTTYEFDSMGRRTRTVLPDGAVVQYGYNSQGELTTQNGARTYPVTYTFTDQGRLESLSTYRNGTNGTADTTTWSYDDDRGWLTGKTYADTSSVTYDYFDNGMLQTRTWARGIESRYSYDVGGLLTNVLFMDGVTPGASYGLDRLGRSVKVVDGLGIRTNSYAADGALLSETLPQLSGGVLEYERDSIGRLTNMALSVGGTRTAMSGYGYDSAGRLSSVSDGLRSAVYTFGPDGATWTNLSFGSVLNTRRTFDGLNRLSEISSQPQTGSAILFSFAMNQANQRTTNNLADGGKWIYQYNERGEVVSGKKYFSDGQPVQGAQFGYEFDTIGNRISAQEGTSTAESTYTANNLNQLVLRSLGEGGYSEILVTGEAATGATVSVRLNTNNAAPVNRHGQYFWKAVDVANASSLFATTNLGVTAYITSGTQSLVRTEARNVILPQTPEGFSWDADGNMLADGLWTNRWDANNRMIVTESRVEVPDGMKKRLTFQYDYMGRRTVKRVESGCSGGVYSATNTTTYVWDGWNVIAEISMKSATGQSTTNFFTWGLDLSGTIQGAGGVGGLTMLSLNGTNALPVFDGNGNVMALVDSSGAVVAEYEYGPFGETLKATGPLAKVNPWRFSTKCADNETGLIIYQLRAFSPGLGRWISRDPIEEKGGINLFAFVKNGPASRCDSLGLRGPNEVLYVWSEKKQKQWFTTFKKDFGPAIDKAARAHCVPKLLLSVIVLNEQADWKWPDGTVFDGIGGGGIGPAQIALQTAIDEQVTGYENVKFNGITWNDEALIDATIEKLRSVEGSVDIAARLMRKYLNELCGRAKTGKFGKGLQSSMIYYGCDATKLCCSGAFSDCGKIVDYTPSDCLVKLMTAMWNSNRAVLDARDPVTEDNFGNAYNHAMFAGAFLDKYRPIFNERNQ